jgi:hypothetical protein
MRWSLILSALIAVQSTLSFVCVALPISTQSDELERREPAGPAGRLLVNLKSTSKIIRENAKGHPHGYHFTGFGAKGKPTDGAKVEQKKLHGEDARHDHANKLLAKGRRIHAGMLLRDVRAAVLNRPLCTNCRSCP